MRVRFRCRSIQNTVFGGESLYFDTFETAFVNKVIFVIKVKLARYSFSCIIKRKDFQFISNCRIGNWTLPYACFYADLV